MNPFNLTEFTDLYLKDYVRWRYVYYKTFFELKDLMDTPIDPSDYFVEEVNLDAMLAEIEKLVDLNWFLKQQFGTALIQRQGHLFQVYVPGERGGVEKVLLKTSDLRKAVKKKICSDLFWINVKKIIE